MKRILIAAGLCVAAFLAAFLLTRVSISQTTAPGGTRLTPIVEYSVSFTPSATSAAVQTAAQTVTVTGIASGDYVVLLKAPAPTSLCPPVEVSATAANTVSVYFSTLTAAACTPAAGTYVFGDVE